MLQQQVVDMFVVTYITYTYLLLLLHIYISTTTSIFVVMKRDLRLNMEVGP